MSTKQIAVVGSGASGASVGAGLTRADHDVDIVLVSGDSECSGLAGASRVDVA